MIENEDGTFTLVPQPGLILQQGTPQNAYYFNRMEEVLVHYATAFDFLTSILQAKTRESARVANNLTTTEEGYTLDARQGTLLHTLLGNKVLWTTVTLEADGWTDLEQKKEIAALKPDHIVIAVGAVENHDAYNGFGIKPVRQAEGELTFAATIKPDVTLTALLVMLEGKEVE